MIDGEMLYCMYNGHADVTRLVNEEGKLVEKYYYDEWGVETESIKYGDINGDINVDSIDLTIIKRYILRKYGNLSDEGRIAADLNGDESIDSTDVTLLKRLLLRKIDYCHADTNRDGFENEKNNIKYSGYFYDGETGLYYLNARYYDPETAKFLQEDTYSGDINDPLSLNLYTYSHNNPVLCFLRGNNKNMVNSNKSV